MENTEKVRYSDEELVEFRDLINKKIEQTRITQAHTQTTPQSQTSNKPLHSDKQHILNILNAPVRLETKLITPIRPHINLILPTLTMDSPTDTHACDSADIAACNKDKDIKITARSPYSRSSMPTASDTTNMALPF